MTDLKMPEPVARFSEDFIFIIRHQPNGERWPVDTQLITTDQAQAYADARVREAQQWQPIETAPKDGTWILAVNATTNPGRQHVVHYSERHGSHYPWVTDSAPMSFVAGVTHWMKLPEPPK